MITLKELVDIQPLTDKKDIEIITDWFIENEMESKGIDLMNILAKSKMDKQSLELRKIKGDLSMYAGSSILCKKFGNEVGGKLDHIIHLFIAGFDIENDYPKQFEWLCETIPTLKCPTIFWRDFYDWLKSKQIYFSEDKNGTND